MNGAKAPTSGFSLVEALVVIAVIGLVAAVVVPSIQEGPDAAKKAKLDQDVTIVNNAIDAYLAAGGAQGALNAGGVVEALKQRVLGGPTAEMTGPLGPFLDPRVITSPTDFDWSARFETSPRPRFVVEKSRNGIMFDRGLPSPIGGPSASANPSWLWSYAPVAAGQVAKPIFEPGTLDSGTILGTTNTVLAGLAAPVISPSSQTLQISGFPLLVSITNPNPPGSSIVYYKIDSGSYVLWVGSPFTVNPGSTISAVSVSIDPSRYYNSTAASETYNVIPLQLSLTVTAPTGVTYAQAGGQIVGQALLAPVSATISLANATDIPAPYLSSSYFSVRYTLDGSDPVSSPTAQTGSAFDGNFSSLQISLGLAVWGANSSIAIRAAAVSAKPAWFTSSPEVQGTSTLAPTALALNVLPANPIGLPFQVLINESGAVPSGLRKYYSTGGVAPLSSASGGRPVVGAVLYSSPIVAASLPSTTYTLIAQATGPAGYEQWFSSAPVTRNYRTVTSLPSEFVGANISGGDVNGTFTGSIFVAAPANLGIFNAGGTISGGNLYVPGLPAIETPGSGNSTKTVVGRGQAYVERGEIPRTLVGGKEYTADGQLADPQLDTRQVVDLNGALTPTNYTIKLTKSAYIEGKIYRRADAPPPPAVPTVPAGLTVFSNTISGVFQTNLPSGVYSNRITMNNTNSVLRLGTAGSLNVTQYVFSGNTWNKGTVEVLGPVEIYFLNGFDNKGVQFGSSNNIVVGSTASLRINVMTNAVDLSGGASVFASLWAGRSAMTVGNASFFYGSIYATTLIVAPGGTVDVQ
ncbi:MAG: prepilin-type N-terminal cleavage/methylation domain-containing protein [Chthoniobacterales bacterium]|nr:prepilin-type N-terminal cleavage/methylation domain-containing protein [Chthoniobacterales bacterium]